MIELLYSLIPIGVIALILAAGIGVAVLSKKGLPWSKKKRNPFTSNFLRGPGQSIQKQIDDLRLDMISILVQLTIAPTLLLLMPLINYALTNHKISTFNFVFYIIIGFLVIIYWLYKMFVTVKKLQQTRLGYEGEVAVGQELNQLMLNGFRVFHDFPADGFNIDHIVVGKTGIFAVETKARSKPTTNNRTNDARLEYDGKTLKFPNWTETKPIKQANIQAKWLKNWLSKAIGETIFVNPVLAVPGWYIDRKATSETYIFNGKYPDKLFPKVSHLLLSDKLIDRICHQLDTKCRDIEPQSYGDTKKL